MKDDISNKEKLTKPFKGRKKIDVLTIIKRTLLVFLALSAVAVVAVTGYVISILQDMPEVEEHLLINYAISTEIYDRNDQHVASLHGVENRMPVALEDISPHMINAVLSVEDKRFYKHPGVDLYRLMGAVVANFKDGFGAQGASTITQQLVKISFFDPKDISIKRKAQEAIVSLKLERTYTKDEILEMYLNKIYFGRGAYGAEAAAKSFFNVSASELTPAQSALLAGVIQNPWANSPTSNPINAERRYKTVLSLMENNGFISNNERQAIIRNFEENGFELDFSFAQTTGSKKYMSFIDTAFDEAISALNIREQESLIYSGGFKIYTTLDTKLQDKMEDIYRDDSKFPLGRGDSIIQSAMIVIDPSSGEIRGLVGGRNIEGARGFNRATQAVRQPGSAMKPLSVFGPALEMGYSPASVFDDYPKAYPNIDNEDIVFRNIDRRHRGIVPMRQILTESINIPSVKAIEEIGIDNGFMFAQDLGITSLVGSGPINDMGFSLALGGLTRGVSPLELTSAYSAFANGGIKAQTHSIRKIENYYGDILYEYEPVENRVMSPQTAYLMTHMLQSAVAEGTGVRARFGDWPIAGKTGTTSFNADIWFVGYTPELIGGIWMGYDREQTMSNVYGGTHAAPVWREIMEVAHEGMTPRNFPVPSGITSVAIDVKSGLLPSENTPAEFIRTELFNAEHVPTEVSKAWIRIPGHSPGTFLVRAEPWQLSGFDVVPEDAKLEPPDYLNPFLTGIDPEKIGDNVYIPDSDIPGFRINGRTLYQGESSVVRGFEISWNWSENREGMTFDIHKSDYADFVPSPSTRVANITSLRYVDESVRADEVNYYKIIAYNTLTNQRIALSNALRFPQIQTSENGSGQQQSSGNTNVNNNQSQPQNQEPAIILSAPNLSISPNRQGDTFTMNLKWSSTNSGNIEYIIYRGTEPGFPISGEYQLNKTRVTDTSFSDSQLEKGKSYFYKVVARTIDSAVTSPASNEVRVGIPAE